MTVAWVTDQLELGGVVCPATPHPSTWAESGGDGGLWSLEGKAGSIPKRDAGLAQGTGVVGRGLVPTRVPGVMLERKDLRNF